MKKFVGARNVQTACNMNEQHVIMSWSWVLNLESLVLGPGLLVLDSGSWAQGLVSKFLGPCPFSNYYKVRQKIVLKCGRYYKVWQLLKSVIESYYKVWQALQSVTENYYKVWQISQSVTTSYYRAWLVLQSVTYITKCDNYYKVKRNGRSSVSNRGISWRLSAKLLLRRKAKNYFLFLYLEFWCQKTTRKRKIKKIDLLFDHFQFIGIKDIDLVCLFLRKRAYNILTAWKIN